MKLVHQKYVELYAAMKASNFLLASQLSYISKTIMFMELRISKQCKI